MSDLKSYCLHREADGKVSMQEPSGGLKGIYYNAHDVDAVIEQKEKRIAELNDHLFNTVNKRNIAVSERDELAAHIERCNSDTDKALNLIERIYSGGFSLNEFEQPVHDLLVNHKFAKSPKVSLAEHDAEVARKAILETAERCTMLGRMLGYQVAEKSTLKSFSKAYAKEILSGKEQGQC